MFCVLKTLLLAGAVPMISFKFMQIVRGYLCIINFNYGHRYTDLHLQIESYSQWI